MACLSSARIGPLNSLLQSALSLAVATALFQVAKPIFCLSPSTVFLDVSLGQLLLLLPSGAQVRAMCGFCWWSICNTCPIQHHVHLLIFLLMIQVLALCLTSLLIALISQYIFNTLHMCLWRNVSSFASSLLVIIQVLHP